MTLREQINPAVDYTISGTCLLNLVRVVQRYRYFRPTGEGFKRASELAHQIDEHVAECEGCKVFMKEVERGAG